VSEVSTVRTPLDAKTTASVLERTLLKFGEVPSREECCLLLAHIWLETGRGLSCNNWNVGNLAGSSGDYWRPPWFTVDANSSAKMVKLHADMLAGRQPSAFRAYSDLNAGMADYVRLILTSRYAPFLNAARQNDATAMARAITTTGYTVDAPPNLDQSLASLEADFLSRGLFETRPLVECSQEPMPDTWRH
jgi:hypothetical protein